MKKMSFKQKLILSILLMSTIPLIIISFYSLNTSRTELEKNAFNKLSAIRDSRNETLVRYLEMISSQILTYSHNKMIVDAAKDFSYALKKISPANKEEITELKNYYTSKFAIEYKNKTNKESPYNETVSLLSPESQLLQHAFISSNPKPLGSKHLLDETNIVPEYSSFHKIYHPIIREFLDKFYLYDIFIIDINSNNIVYTVFKELDFATNIISGPFKDSNLAKVYKEAKEINNKEEFKIVDFQTYGPSYEAPASFIAAPIWSGDQKIAVLVFQMPLGTINTIMSDRSGLGQTGESYLIGADKRLRSDVHNNKEMNIFNSFNKEKLINSENIKNAIDFNSGENYTLNYDNHEVLASYRKISYSKLPWIIFTEISKKEAFLEANKLRQRSILFILITLFIVIAISLYITSKLSNQLEDVVEVFSGSAHDVQNSSQKIDLISHKLYKTVQEQISSITKSAVAMDEISAMIKNNTKSSEKASNLSSDSKDSAEKGKNTVLKMIEEVKEISKSYDDIEKSVEKNIEDNQKIIQVISEIAKKTTVINEIVFQTKLLSFNASVEAARAGESGKGFAVVAEEIANLAAMSGQAANEINSMLSSSQNQVKDFSEMSQKRISSILSSGRVKVVSGTRVADLCMMELNNILDSINQLDESIKEITFAITEQSIGVEEVNTAMKYLENTTHDTTDMSEKSKAASVHLRQQSAALRESIQILRKILGSKKDYSIDINHFQDSEREHEA